MHSCVLHIDVQGSITSKCKPSKYRMHYEAGDKNLEAKVPDLNVLVDLCWADSKPRTCLLTPSISVEGFQPLYQHCLPAAA